MTIKALLLSASLLAVGAAAQAQTLTVYTAGPGDLIERLADDFTKETGVAVDIFQATTGQIMARIEAEMANPVVDVLISASWDTAVDFDAEGLLLPHESANAARVPEAFRTETYVAQGISALAIAFNPQSGLPAPAEWADLTDPVYRDMVTMPDPAQSGSAFELVAALAGQDGGWALFEGLKENEMIVPGPNAAALNPVLQGAKGVVFGAVDYISLNQKADGESIEVIFPGSGTVVAPRPMMIMASTDVPDAARAFVDFVLSDAGQARVAEVNLMPARTDVAADRPLISDLTLLPLDSAAVAAGREATLARFAEIFGTR
jgi:iron(III) transport system substrate-binding protein